MEDLKLDIEKPYLTLNKENSIDNAKRVAQCIAHWMLNNKLSKVVIGKDETTEVKVFTETIACVFGTCDIKVHLAKTPVSIPMILTGLVKTKSDIGLFIALNEENGSQVSLKMMAKDEQVLQKDDLANIESLLPENGDLDIPNSDVLVDQGMLNYIDLEDIYTSSKI